MPTLNETRVRVEGLSNITATARGPSSGRRENRSALSSIGEVEHLDQLVRAEVVVTQEVPGHLSRQLPAGPRRPGRRHGLVRRYSLEGGPQDRHCLARPRLR